MIIVNFKAFFEVLFLIVYVFSSSCIVNYIFLVRNKKNKMIVENFEKYRKKAKNPKEVEALLEDEGFLRTYKEYSSVFMKMYIVKSLLIVPAFLIAYSYYKSQKFDFVLMAFNFKLGFILSYLIFYILFYLALRIVIKTLNLESKLNLLIK